MKITKKLELIKKLTDEIRERYDETDKEAFFEAFNLDISWEEEGINEYYVNTKKTLHSADNSKLKEIAEELGIGTENIIITPPKNWEKTDNVKAFISHTSEKKDLAKSLRNVLKPYNIDCFVAHEDIKPSKEWQDEIDKALQTMDFFISMHTEGFIESFWCQQEIGYAVARNVKIIPIKFGSKHNPVGFIGKIQALSRGDKEAQIVAKEIIDILESDEKTKHIYDQIQKASELIAEDKIPF